MLDETDLSQEKNWFGEERARVAVANLQKRKLNACYVPGREAAVGAILDMIPEGAVVVRGDSISIDQVGIVPELKKQKGIAVKYPLEIREDGTRVHTGAEILQTAREAFFADVFLTGINAVTLDGKLVNTDGWGNRVSPLIFGPQKVIVVAGTNKIVRDVDEALDRVRVIAAPVNARRHFLKHHEAFGDLPCVKTGRCVDCRSDMRICNYTVIVEGAMAPHKGRINVVLIGEDLGI